MKKTMTALLAAVCVMVSAKAICAETVPAKAVEVESQTESVSGIEMPVHIPEAGEYLYLALEDPNLDNLENVLPISIELHIDRSGWGRTAKIEDEEMIKKAVEAFLKIKIKGTGMSVTDNYNWIRMTFAGNDTAEGQTSFINLSLDVLEVCRNDVWYSFELEELEPFAQIFSEYLIEDTE